MGAGRITYVGADLDAEGLKGAVAWLAKASGVAPVAPDVPEGVDVSVRSGGGRRVVVMANFADGPREVRAPQGATEVLSGARGAAVTLPRYGVAVFSSSGADAR